MLTTYKKRINRVLRVRKKLKGTQQRPRLCIIKSNKHLSVQIIDDEQGKTLASAATFGKKVTELGKKNKETAKKLGQYVANLAKEKGIQKVVFDRGFSKYHGVIKAFADGAREAGLEF
jgi:large subunit ribosomal protein L18